MNEFADKKIEGIEKASEVDEKKLEKGSEMPMEKLDELVKDISVKNAESVDEKIKEGLGLSDTEKSAYEDMSSRSVNVPTMRITGYKRGSCTDRLIPIEA